MQQLQSAESVHATLANGAPSWVLKGPAALFLCSDSEWMEDEEVLQLSVIPPSSLGLGVPHSGDGERGCPSLPSIHMLPRPVGTVV